MGKPNGKRKPRGSSYFDPLIEQHNGDIFKASERQLRDKIPLLIKDICRGNVSYSKYGKYFTPEMILLLTNETILIFNLCADDYTVYKDYIMRNPNNEAISVRFKTISAKYEAYRILLEQLLFMYYNGPTVVESVLKTIATKMHHYYKYYV